ncbi:hypothetical protein Ddc_03138 [Ditylenchus destructor]|nr:hypothetical protein Ddc_03138 [Ditylenchus destructor]
MATNISTCYPSCELSLPRIGKVAILSRLDLCKIPAILTFSIAGDGRRSVSSFVEGNRQEIRSLGSEYWPLQLRVNFSRTANSDGWLAQACIETVRLGNVTCFINGVLPASDNDCISHKNGSNLAILILCIILATFFMIGVALAVTTLHRSCASKNSPQARTRIKSTGKSSNNCVGNSRFSNASNFTILTASTPTNNERLTVITEVDEHSDYSMEGPNAGTTCTLNYSSAVAEQRTNGTSSVHTSRSNGILRTFKPSIT